MSENSPRNHGLSKTPEYRAWAKMWERVRYPVGNSSCYAGVSICDEWRDPLRFISDVGPRPSPTHSIDRIDVYGNYCPGNVRWATKREQLDNRREYASTAAKKAMIGEGNGKWIIVGYLKRNMSAAMHPQWLMRCLSCGQYARQPTCNFHRYPRKCNCEATCQH